MKKNTFFKFFDFLYNKIICCFLTKNTISKLSLKKFNKRNPSAYLSRLWCLYWRQWLTVSLLIVTILMTNSTVTAQGSIRGIVPVISPKSGSGVDGDAYAHTPAGYENVGDLFDAQHPGIDGHGVINPFTGELLYPGYSFFLQDRYENDLSIFTGSNKVNDDPNTYTWGPGSSPNKNEIQNAGVHFSYGDPALGGLSTDLWALFAGDRQVTNGSSYIDFEFLQKSMTITGATTDAIGNILGGSGGFLSLGTDGGRTVGDILITIEFTNGGGDANAVIRVWTAMAGGGFHYVIHPNSEFLGRIFITNNTSITHVPFDVYGSDPLGTGIGGDYGVNQWAEGAINLTQVFAAASNPCSSLSTVFIRTRSSGNSEQAELKDFPGAPIQFKVDSSPKVAAVATSSLCNGGFGSITLTVTGGLAPYTFSWTGPNNFTASTEDLSSITAGTYQFVIRDSKGCTSSGSVILAEPQPIVVSSATANNPLCYGVANTGFTITATGGTGVLQYSSNNGATYVASGVFTGLTAGTYTWRVRDANGCMKTGTVIITIPVDITAAAVANNPNCFGTANTGFTITATGGTGVLQYSSDNGATYVASGVFTGLTAGTYSWRVRDANGCMKTGTVIITIPTAIVASATPANPRCCNEPDGSITLTFSGGTSPYMVNFNGGGFMAQTSPKVYTGLTAGSYTWIVKDANGCIFTGGTVTLTNPPLLVASAVLVNPVCNGGTDGSITITASGGTGTLMYSINQGLTYQASNVFTGLAAGEYKWRVKDANNCLLKGTFILTTPPAVIVSATLVNPKCNGGADGSITVNATGGNAPLMFSINDGVSYQTSNVFNALAAGQYSWAVKQADGCVSRGMVNLINPQMIVASATTVNPKCNFGADGSVNITAIGGTGILMYSKDDGLNYQTSNIFNGLAAGEFKWVVKDANNCILKGTFTLLNPALIAVSVAAVNPSCCDTLRDGSITLNATGGTGNLMYSIDNGISYQTSNIFGNLSAGEFKWVVKDVNNCQINGTVTLRNPTDPNARTVSTKTTTADFTAYPVPFKDVLTIRYDFDYTSDVNIEVFNVQGVMVLSKTEANAYLNKEITLHLHTYKGQEQIYIVKLTTDRGSSMKKVMSAK